MYNAKTYAQLIDEAQRAQFEGWDFSYIKDRWFAEPLPWDYCGCARDAVRNSHALLDLGTGGGEALESFAPLPARTFATEGYSPNVGVARRRLEALGVQVIDISNDPEHIHLPFPDETFDLITDRHTGAAVMELWRCLKEGGSYITEQVGDKDAKALIDWFAGENPKDRARFDVGVLTEQLTRAGFEVLDAQEAFPECTYKDVGAIVYHLRAIPWMVPGFDTVRFDAELLALHEHISRHGGFTVKRHRFFIHARKGTDR